MEDLEIISMWKAQNDKIEQTLTINKKLLTESINQKAKNALVPLIRLKTIGIMSFIFYIILLGYILYIAISNYSSALNYFIISIGVIFLINIKGFSDYIKHLVWVNQIDYNGSITDIKQQLSKLQLSIINHAKFMVLQLPFWTTFYLSDLWFPKNMGIGYIIFQLSITGSFTFLAYWLYKNQKVENLDKKWFRTLIAGSGGKLVMKAMDFYKELEEFVKE
jgi:hypothetical protein